MSAAALHGRSEDHAEVRRSMGSMSSMVDRDRNSAPEAMKIVACTGAHRFPRRSRGRRGAAGSDAAQPHLELLDVRDPPHRLFDRHGAFLARAAGSPDRSSACRTATRRRRWRRAMSEVLSGSSMQSRMYGVAIEHLGGERAAACRRRAAAGAARSAARSTRASWMPDLLLLMRRKRRDDAVDRSPARRACAASRTRGGRFRRRRAPSRSSRDRAFRRSG